MNCEQINKQIQIVELLNQLGYFPTKENRKEYWYHSPFRDEKTASFKVDIQLNLFYDFGEGIGGKTIDFICRYFNYSIKESIDWTKLNFSFQKQVIPKVKNTSQKGNKSVLSILEAKPMYSYPLKNYLAERGLSQKVWKYIKEIHFGLYEKEFYAIGFENRNGGYELRNAFYKGCTGKDITLIENGSQKVQVFEGFFDFLSYVELYGENDSDFLIMNSIALKSETIESLKIYEEIELYLDNDDAGIITTRVLLNEFDNTINCSNSYKDFKDLNDWLVNKLIVERGKARGYCAKATVQN